MNIKTALLTVNENGLITLKQLGEIIDSINKEKCFILEDIKNFVNYILNGDIGKINWEDL